MQRSKEEILRNWHPEMMHMIEAANDINPACHTDLSRKVKALEAANEEFAAILEASAEAMIRHIAEARRHAALGMHTAAGVVEFLTGARAS